MCIVKNYTSDEILDVRLIQNNCIKYVNIFHTILHIDTLFYICCSEIFTRGQ